jgi:hypothetical protein
MQDSDDDFGRRFLEEFRRLGGQTSKWTFDVLTRLEAAPRSEVAALLRRGDALLPYRMVKAAENGTAVDLAQLVFEEERRRAGDIIGWFPGS